MGISLSIQHYTLSSGFSCAGFIAMYATLASRDVDCCLIPESPFYLEGPGGLYEYIARCLKDNGHMVIVIAEGAGQELLSGSMNSTDKQDASGNKLLQDVGLWISQKIKVWLSVCSILYQNNKTTLVRAAFFYRHTASS